MNTPFSTHINPGTIENTKKSDLANGISGLTFDCLACTILRHALGRAGSALGFHNGENKSELGTGVTLRDYFFMGES